MSAFALHRHGDIEESLAIYRELLRERRESLGDLHPKTCVLKLQMSAPLSDAGHDQEIIDLLTPALAVFRSEYGDTSYYTLGCYKQLSLALDAAGQSDHALTLLQSAYKRYTNAGGKRNIYFASLLYELAKLNYETGAVVRGDELTRPQIEVPSLIPDDQSQMIQKTTDLRQQYNRLP